VSAAMYIKYSATGHFLRPTFAKASEAEAITMMLVGCTIPTTDLPYATDKQSPAAVRYEGLRYHLDLAKAWFAHPRVICFKYEQLIENPRHLIADTLERAGVKYDTQRLQEAVDAISFSSLSSGRTPGVENKASHYRKGIPGDFRNHFTVDHIRMTKELFGQDLISMGYERHLEGGENPNARTL
jgi:hypothetical protein